MCVPLLQASHAPCSAAECQSTQGGAGQEAAGERALKPTRGLTRLSWFVPCVAVCSLQVCHPHAHRVVRQAMCNSVWPTCCNCCTQDDVSALTCETKLLKMITRISTSSLIEDQPASQVESNPVSDRRVIGGTGVDCLPVGTQKAKVCRFLN